MGITSLSATAAERMAGCTFSEKFYTDAYITENGGTPAGTATPSADGDSLAGIELDGVDQRVEYTVAGGELNHASLTILIEFEPDFDYDDNNFRYLFSANASNYYVNIANNAASNVMNIRLGNTLIAAVPSATYSPYWNVGESNFLAISGTTGDTSAWLNGNKILDSDNTAWSPTAITALYLGSYSSGTLTFDGHLTKFQVYDSVLSEADIEHIRLGTTYDYRDNITLDIDCSTEFYRSGTLRARDITGNDNHAKLGNILATAQAPTKITGRRGYTFDGSDDYMSGMTTPTGTFTISVLERTGGAPALSQANDTATKWDDIMSPGQYSNELLTLRVHPTALTTIQKLDEQYQLYRRLNDNNLPDSILLDLDAEGALDFYLDSRSGALADWSRQERAVAKSNITWDDDKFLLNSAGTSYINCTSPKRSKGCWFLAGDFRDISAAGYLTSQFEAAGDQQYGWAWDNVRDLQFTADGVTVAALAINDLHDNQAWKAHGINFESGAKPKGFEDGASLGLYDTAITEGGDTVTTVIGNSHDYNTGLDDTSIAVSVITTRPLSENEHRALYSVTYQNNWETDAATLTNADVEDNVDGTDPACIASLILSADSEGDFVNSASIGDSFPGYGTAIRTAPGKLGYEGTFDGTGAYATITGISDYGGQAMSFWLKRTAVTTDDVVKATGNDTVTLTDTSGTLSMSDDPASADIYVDGAASTALRTYVWQHVVVNSASYRWDISSWRPGLLGSNDYYEGKMVNPRLYNRPLSATQIQAIYAEGTSAKYETKTGARVSMGGETSGNLSNTDFTIGSGSWTISTETIDDFLVKNILCVSAGYIYLPISALRETAYDAAFGQWEFSFYKGAAGNDSKIAFVATTAAAPPAAGYQFRHNSSNNAYIQELPSGSVTGTTSVTDSAWHDYKVTRTAAGAFELFIDGTSSGTGSDTTTDTANYIVMDLDAGDKIRYANYDGTSAFVKRLKHEL